MALPNSAGLISRATRTMSRRAQHGTDDPAVNDGTSAGAARGDDDDDADESDDDEE